MALAKGLAIGLARPAVGVPSLRAWLDADPAATAAVARAGARDAYVLMREADAPRIVDRDELASLARPLDRGERAGGGVRPGGFASAARRERHRTTRRGTARHRARR